MNDKELRFAGHPVRDVLLAGGSQYTPNHFVEALSGAKFNPSHEADFNIKLLGVCAAFECWDNLDDKHQQMLLKTAFYATLLGLKELESDC